MVILIVQGTTPTHTFNLPFAASFVKSVIISYIQNEEIVFSKDETACRFNNNSIELDLSQEETFKLDPQHFCLIELRVLTTENKALKAKIKNVRVRKTYDKGVFKI